MLHLSKKFAQALFLGTVSLNFCWGTPVKKQTRFEEKKIISDKPDSLDKKRSLMSKEVSTLRDVHFSKMLLDASKQLGNKPLPLLTISCECLPKLLQKAMQITDKIFPDYSSLISFAITGFAGGLACPGVDEKAASYVVIFLNEGHVEPVFLFKAQSNCVLVKNLSETKSGTNILKTIPNGDAKTVCWQMYGNATLLNILDKNLKEVFPFVYKENTSEMALKIGVDFNFWNDILQKIESKDMIPIKFFWDTFVISDIKRVEMGFDIVNKDLVIKNFVYPQKYSPLRSFVRSLGAKIKDVSFLNWPSREVIQELVFQNYSGLTNYVASLDSRIKYSQNVADFCTQFKNVWAIIYPLIKDVLAFCDENFTGNTQSYANLQSKDEIISSEGFGFFEGKGLKQEKVLSFMDKFAEKLKLSLKELVDKKLFGWEVCKDISLNVKKSVDKHRNCDIDQIFWKGKGNDAHCPIWFTVYKNYLLYADNVGNLKRLIERMEEIKTFSYLPKESGCFSRTKVNFASVMHTLKIPNSKQIPELWVDITCILNEDKDVLVNTVKVPCFLDVFSLKTILPSVKENARKESISN